MTNETAFEMAASSIRFGAGVTREVGADLEELGVRHVLLVTDPIVRDLPPVQIAMGSLHANGIDAVVYDRVRVEPTDASFLDAIGFAQILSPNSGSPPRRFTRAISQSPLNQPTIAVTNTSSH